MNLDDCAVPQAEGTATTLASPSQAKMTNEAVAEFYRELDPDLVSELQQTAARIRQRTTRAYIEAGRDLQAIKDKLQAGQFHRWLAAEFEMTPRQAERIMAAARLSVQYDNLSLLPKSVVYLLSAPSCPASVRQDFLERGAADKHPSVAVVAAAIAAAKPARAKAAKSCSRTKPATILQEATNAAPSNSPATPDPELVQRADRVALRLLSDLGTPQTLKFLESIKGLHADDIAAAVERCRAKSRVPN